MNLLTREGQAFILSLQGLTMNHLMEIDALKLGEIGEKLAVEYLARQGYSNLERPFLPYLGDIVGKKSNEDDTYFEVKTIRTNRATVRKDKSQHLMFADYVLVLHVQDCGIDVYRIPVNLITTKRIYVSRTSMFGKYWQGTL